MSRRIVILLALVVAVIGFSGCSRNGSSSKVIQIKGSDTMVMLGQSWTQAFMERNAGVQCAVTGGGSGTGIAALINGTTNIAEASREMEPEELAQAKKAGRNPKEFVVALDALTVVVNPKNPVGKLTMDQLAGIYTGKITNWSELGGKDQVIVVLSREKNSGTHVYFLEHVLRGGHAKGPEQFDPRVQMLISSKAVSDEIINNQFAIGYFGLGWLNPQKHKAITVAKTDAGPYVSPSVGTAKSGTYPISRKLYLYTDGEPTGNVKAFIDFAMGVEGQKIVAQQGFVPIRK